MADPAAAQETDAPPWSQLQGGATHTGAADGPAPPYRTVWEAPVDTGRGDVLLGPVVADGTVVVVSPDSVVAIDAATGAERWSVGRDGTPAFPAIADAGEAPVVVYTDGDDAETAAVVAVSLEDGSPVWEWSLDAEPSSGVTVDGGRAFVVDDDGTVYALQVADGSEAWRRRISGTVVAPPAASGGGVFVVAGNSETAASARIVGLDAATGEPLWPAVVPDVTAAFGSVAAIAEGDIVVALQDGVVYGLSEDDGSTSWSVRVSALVSPFSSPAVADGSVFVADRSGGVHRVSASGREWLFAFNEGILRQSPLVLGEAVVVGFEDGGVGAVDIETGRMVFRTPATGVPVTGMAIAGDTLVVAHGGSETPRVVGLATDPAGSLVDEASPTDPVAVDLASSFGIALVLVAGIAAAVGRLIRSRYEIRDPSGDTLPAEDTTEEPT